jgi:hypothetical protein
LLPRAIEPFIEESVGSPPGWPKRAIRKPGQHYPICLNSCQEQSAVSPSELVEASPALFSFWPSGTGGMWFPRRKKVGAHLPRRHPRRATTHISKMGKKRKAGGRAYGEPKAPKDDGSKLAINSWEDVADSEDEFLLNREKVLLDEGPAAKKLRKWQEEGELL